MSGPETAPAIAGIRLKRKRTDEPPSALCRMGMDGRWVVDISLGVTRWTKESQSRNGRHGRLLYVACAVRSTDLPLDLRLRRQLDAENKGSQRRVDERGVPVVQTVHPERAPARRTSQIPQRHSSRARTTATQYRVTRIDAEGGEIYEIEAIEE